MRLAAALAGIGQRLMEMERVKGLGYIAGAHFVDKNPRVTNDEPRWMSESIQCERLANQSPYATPTRPLCLQARRDSTRESGRVEAAHDGPRRWPEHRRSCRRSHMILDARERRPRSAGRDIRTR